MVGCALVPSPPPSADRLVDSWPVGEPYTCESAAQCEDLRKVALEGLDEYYAGHADVVGLELHREGVRIDPATGNVLLAVRSGNCCQVALFRLSDGTERALGVGYPGIATEPMAFPEGP